MKFMADIERLKNKSFGFYFDCLEQENFALHLRPSGTTSSC